MRSGRSIIAKSTMASTRGVKLTSIFCVTAAICLDWKTTIMATTMKIAAMSPNPETILVAMEVRFMGKARSFRPMESASNRDGEASETILII